MKRIAVGTIVLLAAVAIVWTGATSAADFPKKRITYNICFNPGGESDITARIQEQALKKFLGADVAIQYKIGGGGALCWSELVQSAPDGYTIAGHNLPHTILQPMEMGDAGYKTLDLKQIYMFESTPNLLLVRSDSPYKTLKDFVEYAKKTPGAVTWFPRRAGTAEPVPPKGTYVNLMPAALFSMAVPRSFADEVPLPPTVTTPGGFFLA